MWDFSDLIVAERGWGSLGSFGCLLMSAVSWLVWSALHIRDHTGGLVLLQNVLPKSESKACSWCNSCSCWLGPALSALWRPGVTALVSQAGSLPCRVARRQWCVVQWLAVSVCRGEEPWLVVFEDLHSLNTLVLAYQATKMMSLNAE